MTFHATRDGGRWWSDAHGATRDLLSLGRYKTNRSIVGVAQLMRLVEASPYDAGLREQVRTSYEALKALPPGILARVARHPSFGYWVTKALDAVDANSRSSVAHDAPDPGIPITSLLVDLRRFAVAGRIILGDDFDDDVACVHDVLTFPTTGIALLGFVLHENVHLSVSKSGQATRVVATQSSRSIVLETDQPTVMGEQSVIHLVSARGIGLGSVPRIHGSAPGFELDRWDPYLCGTWARLEVFPQNSAAALLEPDRLEHAASILRQAMVILKEHRPLMEEEIAETIRSVVPMKSLDPDKNLSVSASEFWGSLLCTLDPAHMMGEVLVHEYRHNLLNVLMEIAEVFTRESPQGAHFYSPWRDDPRPLSGILHAMFTFLEVVRYYQALITAGAFSQKNGRAASRRCKAHALRLNLAYQEFIAHARLSDFGAGLLDGLREGIAQAVAFSEGISGPDVADIPALIVDHAQRSVSKRFSRA